MINDKDQKTIFPITKKIKALLLAEGFTICKSERIFHRDWNYGLTVCNQEYIRGEMERITINSHELEG